MKIISGDNQVVARLRPINASHPVARFTPIKVQLMSGKLPLAGETVIFTVKNNRSEVYIAPNATTCSVVTDKDGVATLNKMNGDAAHAYFSDGSFIITAVCKGKTLRDIIIRDEMSVTINCTVGPVDDAFQLIIVEGNNQAVHRTEPYNEAMFAPLKVKVTSRGGKRLKDVPVSFWAGEPPTISVFLNGVSNTHVVVKTDQYGYATLNDVSCSGGPGPVKVVARIEGLAVTFDLEMLNTAEPPVILPAFLTVIEGNNQAQACVVPSGGQYLARFQPIKVQLKDINGKPIAGHRVTFSAERRHSAYVKMDPIGTSSTSVRTDAEGIATLNKMGGKSIWFYRSMTGPFSVVAAYGIITAVINLTVLE